MKLCLWTKSTMWAMVYDMDLGVKLCVMNKVKTLYQDQGQAMRKSTLCGSSLNT